jgi:hypothetical protein
VPLKHVDHTDLTVWPFALLLAFLALLAAFVLGRCASPQYESGVHEVDL